MFTIENVLNDEQLKYVACDAIVKNEIDSAVEKYATGILVWYVIKKHFSHTQGFTEEDIVQKIDELVLDHQLMLMEQEGLIESLIPEEGKDINYRITEEGRKRIESTLLEAFKDKIEDV